VGDDIAFGAASDEFPDAVADGVSAEEFGACDLERLPRLFNHHNEYNTTIIKMPAPIKRNP